MAKNVTRDTERLQMMQSNNKEMQSNNKELFSAVSRIQSNNKELKSTASELTSAVSRMELALLRLKKKRQKVKTRWKTGGTINSAPDPVGMTAADLISLSN
jgi:predicted nuclease with TOPRIM domain